jgi:hypothetical protein
MRHHQHRSRFTSLGLATVLVLTATATTVCAHGGMASADDLGPPLFTSGALAFVCYWLVILWPASKRKGSDDAPPVSETRSSGKRQHSSRSSAKTSPKPSSQLRKVSSNGALTDLRTTRTASDE